MCDQSAAPPQIHVLLNGGAPGVYLVTKAPLHGHY
jgi:hypothetical protein